MSHLRQRARVIKDEGAIQRRNWNPSPDSAHYKFYRYWQRSRRKYVARENFCHYWRVVLIWAPLLWLCKALAVVTVAALAVLLGFIIYKSGFQALDVILAIAGVLAAYAYLIWTLIVGQIPFQWAFPEVVKPDKWLTDKPKIVKVTAYASAAPLMVVILLILFIGRLGYYVFVVPQLRHRAYERFFTWLVTTHLGEDKPARWIRPWLGVPLIFVLVTAPFGTGRHIDLWVVIVLASVGALIGVVIGLAALIAFRRTAAEHLTEPFRVKRKTVSKRQPLKAFFRGVGDFLVLIWSVILTRKWKICPKVDIPESYY